MSNSETPGGWAVAVYTERMGGGVPMMVLYLATFSDKETAIDLVRRRFAAYPGDKIGEAYPISKETVEALGMEPGECDML